MYKTYLVKKWFINEVYKNGVNVINWYLYSPNFNSNKNLWKFFKNMIYNKFPEFLDMLKNQNSLLRLENTAKQC